MTAIVLRHSFILLLCCSLLGCGQQTDEPSQTDKVIAELRSLYEKALEQAPDDPVEWAKEDIARYGDWEYRVAVLDDMGVDQLEYGLNQLGAERWEVFGWSAPAAILSCSSSGQRRVTFGLCRCLI